MALESSAISAGAAVIDGEKLVAESFVNAGLTHSVTLLPLVRSCFDNAGLSVDDIDRFAVSAGPGSFTGVRIGVATLKGLAFSSDKPCVAVSTLEALAYNLLGFGCTALAVMDARCSQVYAAAFDCADKITRLCEDRAVMISDLPELIKNSKNDIVLLGDGAQLCYNELKYVSERIRLAPSNLRFQRASSVARAADEGAGAVCSAAELKPVYLRLPQAERELKRRQNA